MAQKQTARYYHDSGSPGGGHTSQIEEVAELLEYDYYFFDATSSSHIDEGMMLGNGVISRHPMAHHSKGLFLNPHIEATIQGRPITTHDKGYGACTVTIDGQEVSVTTLHLLPFRSIGIDFESEVGRAILGSVESAVLPNAPVALVQGDFNIDSEQLAPILPNLLAGMNEIPLSSPTTPSGKRYDHVLYKGLALKEVQIDPEVKTDHWPVTCVFSVGSAVGALGEHLRNKNTRP